MEGLIQLSYLPTESQLADVLTKILPSQQHWSLLHKLECFLIPSLRGVLETLTARASAQASFTTKLSWKIY